MMYATILLCQVTAPECSAVKTAVKNLCFIHASPKPLQSRSYFRNKLLLALLFGPLQVMVKMEKLKARMGLLRVAEQDVGWRDGGTGKFCAVENHLKNSGKFASTAIWKTQHTNNQKTPGGVLRVHSTVCCELPCKHIHRFTLLTLQKSPALAFYNLKNPSSLEQFLSMLSVVTFHISRLKYLITYFFLEGPFFLSELLTMATDLLRNAPCGKSSWLRRITRENSIEKDCWSTQHCQKLTTKDNLQRHIKARSDSDW